MSFDEWAEGLARRIADGGAKVWIAVDPDVLDVGSAPDFASEPLGPTLEEVIELLYRVGRAAGKDRLAGISIMATPHDARALHQALLYVLLYIARAEIRVFADLSPSIHHWPEENTSGAETFELLAFSRYEIEERAPYLGETRAKIGGTTWKRLDHATVEALIGEKI